MADPADFNHSPERTSLPLEIHAASRSYHTALNRLITSRLPLCLPPYASTPARYFVGIWTFGQIYLSFEWAWDEYLASGRDDDPTYDLLKQLKMPSLFRSTRLKADLEQFNQCQDCHELQCKAGNEDIKRLTSMMRQSILERPYLVMSYSWVMYMALFNGGRWIRDQLNQAGPDFWGIEAPAASSRLERLSFWDFEGSKDGEDIKADFKARFNATAAALSEPERQGVIDESVKIFEICSQMVALLDDQTRSSTVIGLQSTSWLTATVATVSSAVCAIWSGLTRSMAPIQRSDFTSRINDDVHSA